MKFRQSPSLRKSYVHQWSLGSHQAYENRTFINEVWAVTKLTKILRSSMKFEQSRSLRKSYVHQWSLGSHQAYENPTFIDEVWAVTKLTKILRSSMKFEQSRSLRKSYVHQWSLGTLPNLCGRCQGSKYTHKWSWRYADASVGRIEWKRNIDRGSKRGSEWNGIQWNGAKLHSGWIFRGVYKEMWYDSFIMASETAEREHTSEIAVCI